MSVTIQNIQWLREQTGAGLLDCQRALREAENDVGQALRLIKATGIELAEKKAERIAADGIAYSEVIDGKAVLVEINTETDFAADSPEFRKVAADIAKTIAFHQPESLEHLLQCTCKGQSMSVASVMQKMVMTFRENIQLRRFAVIAGDNPIAYMHLNGKYGVILNVSANGSRDPLIRSIGKDLAMQIASMAPAYLSREHVPEEVLARVQSEIRLDIASDKKLNGKPENVIAQIYQGRIHKFMKIHCLPEQPFIRDDSLTVGQFLESQAKLVGTNVEVTEFCRYEKGEGL